MFGLETFRVIFLVSYVLVAFAAISGLLKFAFKNNEVLQLLHKMSGPIVNALYLVFFLFAIVGGGVHRFIPRVIITALFIVLVYTGLVTGHRKDKTWVLIVHRILGIGALALFTMLLIYLLMIMM
jgi:hypothetical protein